MKNISIKFNLFKGGRKNLNEISKTFIMISVNWENGRLQKSTGLSLENIIEKNESFVNWDKENCRVKSKYDKNINTKLDEIQNKLKSYHDYCKSNESRTPGSEEMNIKLQEILHPDTKKIKTKLDFFDYFKQFIEETKNGHRLSKKGTQIQRGTYKTYLTTKTHLENFQKEKGYKISFDKMNKDFFATFLKYLTSLKINKGMNNLSGKKQIGLTDNYQAAIVKILKTFLNYALEKGYTSNVEFIKAFTLNKKETDLIALTAGELQMIENFETENRKISHIKNLLMFQCYTGLRFSDMKELTPENFDLNRYVINIQMVKTQGIITIPIGEKLKQIINSFPGLYLNVPSNQKYNDYLKDLCKQALIIEPVKTTTYIGNARKEAIQPKNELISSHTARRTYITLSLKAGKLPETVMKISGHKNRTAFNKYVKIAQNEAIENMREPF